MAESIFAKIGDAMRAKPVTQSPPKKADIKPPVPGKKPFDINIYFKAVGMYYSDLFNKKMPYFFKNIGPVFQNLPTWWNKQPQDLQISYGALFLGNMMIIVGVVLVIIL